MDISLLETYKTHIVIALTIILALAIFAYYIHKQRTKESHWWKKQSVTFRPQRSSLTPTQTQDGQISLDQFHPEVQPPPSLQWDTTAPSPHELQKFINAN